jgi:peptidoglycan hydrolase-like protein with peptidoglycan-binding domain
MGPSTGVSSGGVVSAVFTKNLGPGVTSSDVKRLQQLLNTDPDTMIAESGAGSPGRESGFYGALTVTAVQKFQSKYGLVSEGTPSTTGYGALGPKTRAAVEMYLGGAEVSVPTSVSPAPTPTAPPTAGPVPSSSAPVVYLTSALAKGKTHSDVKALQQVLNSDSDTMISDSGTGSPGNETDFYGAMTEKAVQKFQQKYGIAVPGDPGYGAVGPKTRAKINELFGAQGSMEMEATPMSAPTPTPTPSVSGSNDDIQTQINAALKKVTELQGQIGGQTGTVTPPPPAPTPPPAPASSSNDAIQAQINAALKKVADLQVQIGGQTVTPPPPAPTPAPPPASTSADTSAIEKQIQDAMKKIQEISAQIKAQS